MSYVYEWTFSLALKSLMCEYGTVQSPISSIGLSRHNFKGTVAKEDFENDESAVKGSESKLGPR